MRYLSICSGIEAASAAWSGWSPVAFAEIDPFARAVLAHHYPHVPNLGDFTRIGADDVGTVDLVVGGTPCQDFSVAGLRAGLDGKRGQLTLEFVRLLERVRPRWVVWENVAGVLSIDRGRAFGLFLGLLGQCGYGFAYRVLDAQYFGVPQRRRRVFVVGYLGDWRRAAAVLLERESLRGDSPARGKARSVASALTAHGVGGGGGPDDNAAQAGHLIASTLSANSGRNQIEQNYIAHTLRADGFDASEDGTGRGTPLVPIAFDTTQITSGENRANPQPGSPCHPLSASAHPPAIAFRTSPNYGAWETGDRTDALTTGTDRSAHLLAFNLRGREGGAQVEIDHLVNLRAASGGSSRSYVAAMGVRRITPREAERLQGFPDDYTLAPYRGKLAADAPRYRALGNSMAVPVMRWIGERIALVESIIAREVAA